MSDIPNSVIDGLYKPGFLPKKLALNEFLENPDLRREQVRESVRKKVTAVNNLDSGQLVSDENIAQPLTPEEAEEVDRYIESLKERIAATKGRISDLREFIDETANPSGGQELSFTLNIDKKGSLKRAVRKIFGKKVDTVTYSMYKAAVELKRTIEQEEKDAYLEGQTASEEE